MPQSLRRASVRGGAATRHGAAFWGVASFCFCELRPVRFESMKGARWRGLGGAAALAVRYVDLRDRARRRTARWEEQRGGSVRCPRSLVAGGSTGGAM